MLLLVSGDRYLLRWNAGTNEILFPSTVVCKLVHISESPGGLLKYRLLGLSPRGFGSVGQQWGCSVCLSNKFPGENDILAWEPHFENRSYSTAPSTCPLVSHFCVPGEMVKCPTAYWSYIYHVKSVNLSFLTCKVE